MVSETSRLVAWSWGALAWSLITTAALFFAKKRSCSQALPQSQTHKLRLDHFSGYQFLMCCIIIWHHYFESSFFTQIAYHSVTFFVFFSGFVTQHAYRDKMSGPEMHLIAFFLRRIGRVLPLYYAIHFAVLRLQGQPWWTGFWRSALMMCTWYGSSPETNIPAWTVCALVWCWLSAPLAAWLLRQVNGLGPLGLWLAMLAAGIVYELWSRLAYDEDGPLDRDYWFYETRTNVLIFWLGMACADVAISLPPAQGFWSFFWPIFSDVTLLGSLLCTAEWRDGSLISWSTVYWSGCLAPVAIWVLTSTIGHPSLLTRIASHRLPLLLGEYSMQLYMLADPLRNQFMGERGAFQTYSVIMVVGVFVADCLERPWAEWLKKRTDMLQRAGRRVRDADLEEPVVDGLLNASSSGCWVLRKEPGL